MTYLTELAVALLPDNNEGHKNIRIIESDHPTNVQFCFTEFINVWMQQKPATWKELIDALCATQRTELAKHIGSLLTPPFVVESSSAPQPQDSHQQAPTTEREVVMQMQTDPQYDDEGMHFLAYIATYVTIAIATSII